MKYLALILALLIVSCGSVDKKHFKSEQFYKANKDKLAELCALEYPSVPKYIKGDTIVKVKEVKSEPIIKDCPDGSKVVCPENKTIYKTIMQTDTIVKPNTALEAKLRNEINELRASNTILEKENIKALNDLKQKDKELNKRNWTIAGLSLALSFLLVIILKK